MHIQILINPTTTIEYQIPSTRHVSVKVYDVLGREVATVVDEVQAAGAYRFPFDASGLASGVYIYRLQTATRMQTKKFILLR